MSFLKLSQSKKLLILAFILLNTFTVSLSLFRVLIADSGQYLYMNWNLFLALIPLVFSYLLNKQPKLSLHSGWLIFGWLLFFPNSGYIITDLLHIADSGNNSIIPLWYDVLLVFFYALVSLLTALYSLYQVHKFLMKNMSEALSWVAIASFIFLNGLGIYLGRFLRFNSWDIVSDPLQLILKTGNIFIEPLQNTTAWGIIVIFFFGFVSMYLLTYSLLHRDNLDNN